MKKTDLNTYHCYPQLNVNVNAIQSGEAEHILNECPALKPPGNISEVNRDLSRRKQKQSGGGDKIFILAQIS